MTTFKGTPGPWVFVDNGWIDGGNGYPVVEYDGCGSHAAAWRNPDDLRLALAAPDYFAAAEAFIAYEDAMDGDDHVAAMNFYARASALLREAHAKATGAA
jgi:hypothetical protein